MNSFRRRRPVRKQKRVCGDRGTRIVLKLCRRTARFYKSSDAFFRVCRVSAADRPASHPVDHAH